mgnify:CR=1 FL=1
MSLEESLIFWRRAFHPTFSDDQFNKKYSYGVRHSYGQEGKRADYPPYRFENTIYLFIYLFIY